MRPPELEPPPAPGPTPTGLSLARPRDPLIGTRIRSFLVQSVIGSGGMGTVYVAEQGQPHRTVALKIIKLGMDTAEVLARFEIEREALALMNHPGIAKVFDAGATEQGRPYFAMEYVPGVPITEHCDRHKLDIGERLELLAQVCDAVQHAHQKGIIHRDLKPSNILVEHVDGKATPKIIDFGIAKALNQRLSERSFFTERGQIVGTLEYMSPEQAAMSGQDIDTRTDIYSLGAVLYELLTGALPIDSATLRQAAYDEFQRIVREVEPAKPSTKLSSLSHTAMRPRGHGGAEARRHEGQCGGRPPVTAVGSEPCSGRAPVAAVESRPEAHARAPAGVEPPAQPPSSLDEVARNRRSDPRTLPRDLRGDLDWIVMKCLAKDRARRYESASALAADIQRHLRHEPVVAGPPSAAYHVRKFVRRNRGAVLAAGLVALSLVAGLIGTTTFALREARERKLALRRADETRRVADFQATMLSDVDLEAMGCGLIKSLRAEVEAGLQRQSVGLWPNRHKLTEEEIAAGLAAFDGAVGVANPTDAARHVMSEYVLRNAADTLEREFMEQPVVAAALHASVGRTYRAIAVRRKREFAIEHRLRTACFLAFYVGHGGPTLLLRRTNRAL